MITADQVDRPAGPGWNAKGALNLPDTWFLVDLHRPAALPMSTAMFVTMFFEETACCNMVQQGTPAAIGPGQMQVSEQGKIDFFAGVGGNDNGMGATWDSSMTILAVNQATAQTFHRTKRLHPDLPELTKSFVLGNNEFAIKMHVKFMHWLSRGFGPDKKTKGLDGLLAAQTGGGANVAARQAFKNGAAELEKLMKPDSNFDTSWSASERQKYLAKRRLEFAHALNIARKQFKGNGIPTTFTKFWEFFLPDAFLSHPMAYIRWGI